MANFDFGVTLTALPLSAGSVGLPVATAANAPFDISKLGAFASIVGETVLQTGQRMVAIDLDGDGVQNGFVVLGSYGDMPFLAGETPAAWDGHFIVTAGEGVPISSIFFGDFPLPDSLEPSPNAFDAGGLAGVSWMVDLPADALTVTSVGEPIVFTVAEGGSWLF
ncbi:hypothetical protein [Caulobacter sp. NIBR2454]|uniref:hypothetical protein n=1 Tax=Caulobacter sp. NIBR2454 TaxID=3015996 RepID=UPI0022B69AAB|nr:hypothetical protein [Caulobacter sp. NIBR2454]